LDNKIRRKAQKLTQQGAYAEAIAEYEKLSGMAALEPYDLVIFADLLARGGRREEAVQRYLQAMDSYAESGLNRNAIALGKKVQRMAPDIILSHRKLGDIYAADGLASESCLHYLEYLEHVKGTDPEEAEEIESVCQRLLELSLPSFDIVGRVVEKAQRVERGSTLAPGVLQQARRAAAVGNPEAESKLRDLAASLDPDLLNAAPDDEAGASAEMRGIDPGAVDLQPSRSFEGDADASGQLRAGADASSSAAEIPSEEVPVLSLDEVEGEPEATGLADGPDPDSVERVFAPPAPGLTAPSEAIDSKPGGGQEHDEAEGETDEIPPGLHEITLESEGSTAGPIDSTTGLEDAKAELGDLTTGPEDVTTKPDEISAESSSSASHEKGRALRARGLHFLELNDPIRAQREFMNGAKLYFDGGQTHEAEELYELVVKMDPNHLDALRGLVEIAHINGERSKMARWGCELGDVLLAREKYAEAKVQFERVLAFDPENLKAQARLKRLNTMAGVKEAEFGKLTPAVSEVKGAQVTVRDDEPQSQFTLNLSQILEEFRAAVVERIPVEDGQSHHDLGMTYMEMGLIEEAVHEFEIASTSEENSLSSMEMLAECYLLLDRQEDALRVFGDVLELAPEESKPQVYVNLGRAHEALGEWDQAEEKYRLALELRDDMTEAAELLRDLEQRREQGAA
jgi:tetratricopeptide (TPR) repeat protein